MQYATGFAISLVMDKISNVIGNTLTFIVVLVVNIMVIVKEHTFFTSQAFVYILAISIGLGQSIMLVQSPVSLF